ALLADAPMMAPAYHSPRITAGGEDATIDVMISTSPYCVACATLHRALQSEAIRSRVTFAFYCDPEQDVSGVRMLIAAHALEHEGRTAESRELLDSWFDALHERRSFDESR